MVIGRAEAGQKQSREEYQGYCFSTKPKQADCTDDERAIRDRIPKIWYAEQFALICELMIARILQQWRKR